MGYLKYTQYAYLIVAILFLYEAIMKMSAGEATPWLSFLIAGVGIFMFFFRRKFAKKMENQNKK